MGTMQGTNRVRSTGTITIFPVPLSTAAWCCNEHKSKTGLLRIAGYRIVVFDHPLGSYCKECAKEIWKIWNDIIEREADEGIVVRK
jgi:hypothetical protein